MISLHKIGVENNSTGLFLHTTRRYKEGQECVINSSLVQKDVQSLPLETSHPFSGLRQNLY